MKTKNLIRPMMLVIVASIFVTGSLFSQNATRKSAIAKELKMNVEQAYYRYYDQPINISVNDRGVVVLKGSVKAYSDKLKIFSNIAKVKGVTAITEDLLVETEPVPDNIIKDQILNQYKFTHFITEPEKIKVEVDKGMVILTGTVNFYKESEAAEDIAGWYKGVISVDNELDVLPLAKAESDANLTEIVLDVLKDQFSVSSKSVRVNVAQGIVTLTGSVALIWEKHTIGKQVHSILGVKDVTNNLQVNPESK